VKDLDVLERRSPWRGTIRRRVASALRALWPRRGPMSLPPDWEDESGLAPAGVPRRPRPPLRGGAVALEPPGSEPEG
jgi:hypothetical protein